ncbi:MAG: hypothetical protein ACI89J_002552 [Hyphomicrobiaceae bacterium]|jgi:hypothetical protein
MRILSIALLLVFACWSTQAPALDTVKVTDGIYAFVGEKKQRSPR